MRRLVSLVIIICLISIPALRAAGCGFCTVEVCEVISDEADNCQSDCGTAEKTPSCHSSKFVERLPSCHSCSEAAEEEAVSDLPSKSDSNTFSRQHCVPLQCDLLERFSLLADKPTPQSGNHLTFQRTWVAFAPDNSGQISFKNLNIINFNLTLSSTILRC